MTSTSSCRVASAGVNLVARCSARSIPRSARSSTQARSAGRPGCASSPAEKTGSVRRSLAAAARHRASAIGLRQMFAVQTSNVLPATSSSGPASDTSSPPDAGLLQGRNHASHRQGDRRRRPKHLELSKKPGIKTAVRAGKGGSFIVSLTTKAPALWVWLELESQDARLSDNFIHLRNGQPCEVAVTPAGSLTEAQFKKQLRVRSLVDTY